MCNFSTLLVIFVKDDLMNQFLSVLRIDEDKLYFRAEEFAEQYDIDRLDNKERLTIKSQAPNEWWW